MIQENIDKSITDAANVSGSYFVSSLPINLQLKIQARQVKFHRFSSQLLITFRSYRDRLSDWGSELQSEILEKIKDAKAGTLASEIDELWISPDKDGKATQSWGRD